MHHYTRANYLILLELLLDDDTGNNLFQRRKLTVFFEVNQRVGVIVTLN